MTQPLPDQAAQKQAAVEVFAQYEPPLYEAYLDMMVEWLAAVKTAMFTGGVAALGLVPDPMAVFSQTPKWHTLTSDYSEQVAREVLAAPYKDLFADDQLFASRPFVRNWIAQRENRLNRIPDEVHGLVKHIIDKATTNGASIPDVQDQVEKLFSDTGSPNWKNRARTVARTEVVGAYNGGLHDAFSMIAANDADGTYVHRWLATEDARTRPDHVEADGQVQPWGQPFTVGGFQMMHPHDPTAPAKEVVNCRCVELMEIKNEPTKMSNRQYKDGLTADGFGFNPAEKRAHDGKWTKGGGLLKSLVKAKKDEPSRAEPPKVALGPDGRPAHWPPLPDARKSTKESTPHTPHTPSAPSAPSAPAKNTPHRHGDIKGEVEGWGKAVDPRFDSAATGEDALSEFEHISTKPEQKGSLRKYQAMGFAPINMGLASGKMSPEVEKRVEDIDVATKKGSRNKDVVLWRGIKDPEKVFGDQWGRKVTGMEWTTKGFSSTSASADTADTFSMGRGVIMRILVPKDAKVGGVDMHDFDPVRKNGDEYEVLLSRGVRMKVVADHGKDKQGVRKIDVEVVG